MTQFRLVIILSGIALLTGLSLWAGLPAIGRAFGAVGVDGFGLVVLIHAPLIALMGAAWWSIGRTNPCAVLPSFIAARLARDAVAELLPFSQVGGFAAGIHVLSLTGIPARAGAGSLFADLLMEFFAKLPYAIAGLGLLIWLRPGSAVPSYLLLTLAMLIGVPLFLWLLLGLWRDVLLRFVPRCLHRRIGVNAEAPVLRSLLVVEGVAPSGLLHALCWALGGLEAWVTLRLMGMPVTAPEALAIDSLVMSLRTFGFFMPAALGVQETAYVLGCGLFGFSPGEAIAFSFVRRARDVLVGLIGLAVWQKLEMRRARRVSFA